MELFVYGLLAVIIASQVAVVASITRLFARQPVRAARFGRIATFTALSVLPLTVVGAVVLSILGARDAEDPASKATILARGISEGMNLSALAMIAALVAGITWGTATHLVRRGAKSAEPA